MLKNPVPRNIGSYCILNEIGHGATSTVHMAKNIETNEKVCVKIMDKEQLSTEENFAFFKREISIISSLNHPNIVRYYDLLENSQNYFLFMEYCSGESLQSIIDRPGNISESFIITVFRQVLEALRYLHETGVGHRDLKPDNIIIGPENSVKVVDFGLSTNDNSHLRTTFCGSLAFAAPECIQREPYLASRADIWSAGVVLYMMAVKKLPWNTNNIVLMMKKIIEGKISFPSTVPLGCQDLVKMMMRVNPNERPLASQLLEHSWLKHEVKRPHPPSRASSRHRVLPPIVRVKSNSLICVKPPRPSTPRKINSPRRVRQRSHSVDIHRTQKEDGVETSILASIPSFNNY